MIQRLDFARTLTLEAIAMPVHYTLVLEYYVFLERYYVWMYPAQLRRGLAARYGELAGVWESKTESLWRAMPCALQQNARYINIEEPRVVRSRYSSAPRSRSPRED